MTHKNKVKELVGGGLNAYHTKSLQQMDRIEKKNKEQNHKISMLTNELDNDYLTKTEEGSVISLDHSKEGMVYIDSLEGNTMVNYCTDGSKELTLNGDIDLEGTFVTTTEGVDNGLVDVICEGNTLIVDTDGNEVDAGTEGATLMSVGQDDENGHKIEILSQNKNLYIENEHTYNVSIGSSSGMQWATGTGGTRRSLKIPCKPNTSYKIYKEGGDRFAIWTHYEDFNGNEKIELDTRIGENIYSFTTPSNAKVICIYISLNELTTKFMIVEGDILGEYIVGKSNKKEILLNEPLRGLPNGVKDRFVKLGGKWYIERNCVEYTPDTSTATFRKNYNVTSIIDFKIDNIKNRNQQAQTFYMECLSTIPYGDPSGTIWQNETHWLKYYPMTKNTISTEGQRDKGSVSIFYNKEWTDQQIIDWCNNNNLKFILPCETPTYEEITDVELMTYLDTTHISNNSIIPCNMKIKNSGYNAIIKPSTLYTIALDTNKSGTVGINLGGAKGTTTNNVLTLTTPATLTDDSLRLYGKSIKGSKVRLLEGDKTNWIPSHFEGMKSSFEDKVQSDGTYKMEILSNNSNVFNLEECIQLLNSKTICVEEVPNGFRTIQGKSQMFNQTICKFNPKGRYKVSYDITSITSDGSIATQTSWFIRVIYKDGEEQRIYNPNGHIEFATKDKPIQDINMSYGTTQNISTITNIKIVEMKSDTTEEYKSNKIQFSSIEPLRGVDKFKDKFIFKNDGKLYIERNCMEKYLSEFNFGTTEIKGNNFKAGLRIDNFYRQPNGGSNTSIKCDKLASAFMESMIPCINVYHHSDNDELRVSIPQHLLETLDREGVNKYFAKNPHKITYPLAEPYYEEVPFELAKIILEGYENGTLFFDTNIPPTSTVTYAGETPIVKSVKLNKTEVLNNTNDINDNIIPYLMDMDYRVVCLQLENNMENISMARLFGGVYEMLKRDILSKRLTREEYGHRLADYFNVGKLTEQQVRELEDLR